MCGEKDKAKEMGATTKGSPPRVRGKVPPYQDRFMIERMGGVCKEQSYTKRPRLPVMETGGAAVLWETPQALQSLSAAGS